MSVSVLLIGAGGVLGEALLRELIRQKAEFKTVAILATSPEKAEKFVWVKEKGVEIVEGSFLEARSYEGWPFKPAFQIHVSRFSLSFHKKASHMSSQLLAML
jgi:aspartate-semialdehyde dehydrogenase